MHEEKNRVQELLDFIKGHGYTSTDLRKAAIILDEREEKTRKANLELTDKQKIDKAIGKVCNQLKVSQNLHGYKLFKQAVRLVFEDPKISSIEKDVFCKIATERNMKLETVTIPIQKVIELTLEKGDQEELNLLFDRQKGEPSDAEFIRKVAEKVKLELSE